MVHSAVLKAWTGVGSNLKPLPMLADTSNWIQKTQLASMQSAGVTSQVNLRHSVQSRKHASQKSTLALKPRADITRSPKQGYQLAPKSDIVPMHLTSDVGLALVYDRCISV